MFLSLPPLQFALWIWFCEHKIKFMQQTSLHKIVLSVRRQKKNKTYETTIVCTVCHWEDISQELEMCSLGMCINYVHTLWLPGVLSKLFHFNSKILRDVVWILFKKRAKHKKSLCKCSFFASNFVLQNCKPHLFWFLIQNNLRTKLHAFILILKTCSAA